MREKIFHPLTNYLNQLLSRQINREQAFIKICELIATADEEERKECIELCKWFANPNGIVDKCDNAHDAFVSFIS